MRRQFEIPLLAIAALSIEALAPAQATDGIDTAVLPFLDAERAQRPMRPRWQELAASLRKRE